MCVCVCVCVCIYTLVYIHMYMYMEGEGDYCKELAHVTMGLASLIISSGRPTRWTPKWDFVAVPQSKD